MLWGGEFGSSHGPSGLDVLASALPGSSAEDAVSAASPEVATGTEPVSTDPVPATVGASPFIEAEEWPKPESLDAGKLTQARNITGSNKPDSLKLAGFKPAKEKPRKQELWQAVMERDSKQRPKHWPTEKMVNFLITTPPVVHPPVLLPNGEVDLTAQRDPVASAGPPVQDTTPEGDDLEAKKMRWSRNKMARVIMCIADDNLKDKFLTRDRKLNRQEMDAKGRDNFWELCALMYNSPSITFPTPRSNFGVDKYKTLPLGPSPYVADADKVRKEFGALRSDLSKALVNFRKSGQGEC